MKTYEGVDVWIHVFLTPALVGREWSVSSPGHFTQGKRHGSHRIRGWVGPIVGLNDMEKWEFLTLQGPELRPLGRPFRSQPLYRLRYRVS
jgi:hypothetical protein